MGKKEDEFRNRLNAAFRTEAAEHIAAICSGFSELDSTSQPGKAPEIIENTFREIHTLKGAARSLNKTEIELLCQGAESALSALRHGSISFSRPLADLIFLTLGRVNTIIEGEGEVSTSFSGVTTHDLIASLERAAEGEPVTVPDMQQIPDQPVVSALLPAEQPQTIPLDSLCTSEYSTSSLYSETEPAEPGAETRKVPDISGTIRVPASQMDLILFRAEDLIIQKESLMRNIRELDGIATLLETAMKELLLFSFDIEEFRTPISTQIDESVLTSDLSQRRKLADFSQKNIQILHDLDTRIASCSVASQQDLHAFNRQVDGLLSEVREVMLVPATSVLMFLPLAIQEMAASMGKEIELVIEGGSLLVDRRILEGMKDPLIHLVRNAVDHGIEQPEERARAGKSAIGKITVSLIEIAGNRIMLTISDDGRGIDIGQVKTAAQKRGIMETDELEGMGESEIIRLLFRSGLSTSAIITELSGRGLGLAIVEEQAQKYDGDVTIETNPKKSTHVQITLPVRLATLRGVIVRTGDHLFIVPIVYTERVLRVDEQEVQLVEDQRTIRYLNEAIPLISLTTLLGLPHAPVQPPGKQVRYAVVIASGAIRIAIEVDEVIREQELSQKSLGPQLARVSTIAGATITGSGKVIPVLNVVDLVKIATRGSLPTEPERLTKGEIPTIRTLLIVEDSITARMLLKNILQAAGYVVKTAVDGMDAWTVLKTDPIDLVVSDIEMPRMNGFDLTTAIRHDQDLADLPVVLVTALASQKDRERGIDTGANAYIVKSSFDQSNLLDIIGRLIG